jgi:two-component system response regulator DesR
LIRLLLADDQELIRSALAVMLALEEDFEVVASVGRGDEVAAAAREHHPDVALLDIEMPGLDGLAAAGVLAHEAPQCRSVILTTFGRPGYLRRAMESGASGFVVKDAPAEQLAATIRRVAAGERVVDPGLAAESLATGASPLTANVTSWWPPGPEQPFRRSPGSCSCPRERSATTCPPRSPRPGRATVPRRCG